MFKRLLPKYFSQKGIAHVALVVFLLFGIAAGTLLVQNGVNFLPKAAEEIRQCNFLTASHVQFGDCKDFNINSNHGKCEYWFSHCEIIDPAINQTITYTSRDPDGESKCFSKQQPPLNIWCSVAPLPPEAQPYPWRPLDDGKIRIKYSKGCFNDKRYSQVRKGADLIEENYLASICNDSRHPCFHLEDICQKNGQVCKEIDEYEAECIAPDAAPSADSCIAPNNKNPRFDFYKCMWNKMYYLDNVKNNTEDIHTWQSPANPNTEKGNKVILQNTKNLCLWKDYGEEGFHSDPGPTSKDLSCNSSCWGWKDNVRTKEGSVECLYNRESCLYEAYTKRDKAYKECDSKPQGTTRNDCFINASGEFELALVACENNYNKEKNDTNSTCAKAIEAKKCFSPPADAAPAAVPAGAPVPKGDPPSAAGAPAPAAAGAPAVRPGVTDAICGKDDKGLDIPCYKIGVFSPAELAQIEHQANLASINYAKYTEIMNNVGKDIQNKISEAQQQQIKTQLAKAEEQAKACLPK